LIRLSQKIASTHSRAVEILSGSLFAFRVLELTAGRTC